MLVEDDAVIGKPQAPGVLLFSWIHSVFPWFCLHVLWWLPAPSSKFLLSWQLQRGKDWGGGDVLPCHKPTVFEPGLISVGKSRLVQCCPRCLRDECIWLRITPFVLCHGRSQNVVHN